MSLGFRISGRIGKPVAEVFDAVVNPTKLSGYFTTLGGASAPLVPGTTVTWWNTVPVEVDEVVPNERIVLRWDGGGPGVVPAYKTTIEMNFEALDDGGTFVTIAESGWREDEAGRKSSYGNCEGWSQMLSCMKAYVEYGINLREGFYPSEMRGELPTSESK
ncbi:ATPase [Mesorhizobium sp. M2A.F.Ca.ET.037.01.1.1]|uniref:SRPBCC domain-containing protein n=1 Tax=unclassified Mesorhizobium TaxID=325217 RepID=UPI000F765918|nr:MULTISPECIES: SRPBCC domain-containing protein [unclassified Mesorhizobium]RUY08500.1 ATPase [Mesorhizobium sp. M2A.F.Ca.ET.040.01.1.1]RVC67437.1 ATPase [Mesorhizobium sp. M00.F.Ca.ET.038.03.1.1]RVC71634.1 ATPase [Mesorhizobium sp. M2A.F.Ca.ET.046.02.1.1]AZO36171.1 ATPase [Mesorhizobium sp. M2A.F.Ca.ET.046.03.2.1]RUX07586.1 ATPase [Mesorhizobium sp. M2A.F.Ca.ET.037.01.1.1]